VKEKSTVVSPFSGAFPSDRTPNAKKDANSHFLIHRGNSCILYQRILGTFLRLMRIYLFGHTSCQTEYNPSTERYVAGTIGSKRI
jgi:hypothetical protein